MAMSWPARGDARLRAMRTLGSATTLLVLTSVATAAPLATLREDLDGDGSAETVELSADGVLTVAGGSRAKLALGGGISRAELAIAPHRGRSMLVVQVTRGAAREATIVEYRGAALAVITTVKLGGVGLDGDYGVELDAGPGGLYRYQTRDGLRRCDARPAYLFAEGFDGTRFRRLTKIPSGVPDGVPTLPARADSATQAAPQLYQARVASIQPGATDAGGLGIPKELDDGRTDTLWREELSASTGEGQFFTFEPRIAGAKAKQIRIVSGNPASAATMKSVNRPRQIAIATPARAWRVELPDAANDPLGTAYVVDLPEAVSGCVTVVLESTYGPALGATAIAELEVFAEGERAGGGDAMLAKVVAEGKEGAVNAAAALSRRGTAGASAIDAELAKTTDAHARRRLIAVLVKIQDPAAAASLSRAATEGWVTGPELLDLIDALARNGLGQELHDLAGSGGLAIDARVAAAHRLAPSGKDLPLLIDLAGTGPHPVRRAVIDQLAEAPTAELIEAATKESDPAASGDLWRALTRSTRTDPAARASALAAMLAALPTVTDYERRYRLVDGIATLGDAAALRTLDALLRGLPATAETAALRQVAIRAIGFAPRPEAIRLLLSFATDPDPGVRLAVLSALAGATTDASDPWHTADGPDGIDRVIINALGADTWPEIRSRAAATLGARCQRPGPARALVDAVGKDQEIDVRIDALTALVQCHAAEIDQLLVRTWDDSKAPIQLRTQAVSLAVALADPRLGPILVSRFTRWRGAAIESAEALALAQSAAASIARLSAPGAAEALLAALDDSAFPEIVTASALALGALGPACPPAAKLKLDAIGRSDDQAAVAAKRAAAQCGR
ncbi:MAG: lyase domain protein repeat-containing protein [Myxococcales bacterium]|nr:lyase domain protein repeat-containing protein [Myxococcales bacterium]